MTKESQFERHRVRGSFAAAAASYDEVAVLQREVGGRMLERLDYIQHRPAVILDVGAGTGSQTAALKKRYPKARVIALDIAQPMLQVARHRSRLWRPFSCVCADMHSLPLADHSVDMIFSNLALQWSDDLGRVLEGFRRVLRPGGMLLYSTLGPDTLHELRSSWNAVDDYQHVNRFLDMHVIGDAMLQARLAEPVMDVEHITMTYARAIDLMRDLKALGAHNIALARPHALTGAGKLQRVIQAYEAYRRDGVLPASWEVVYGHAWAAESQPALRVDLPVPRR